MSKNIYKNATGHLQKDNQIRKEREEEKLKNR